MAVIKPRRKKADNINTWLQEQHSNGVTLSMAELMRYQQKTHLLDLSPKSTNQSKLAGNYLATSKGRGMEFDEVRHYNPGDDIRTIDWRVTARTGKTHTKLFREEKERPIFILCDLSHNMYFGSQLLFKSVQASHLAALIAWNAKQRGDKIGGLIFSSQLHRELKPKSRQHGVLQLLHQLTLIHQDGIKAMTQPINSEIASPLEQACSRLRRVARPGSLIYVISDFHQTSQLTIKHLSQMARHCEVIACEISDPMEHQLPSSNIRQSLKVTDGSTIQNLFLGDKNLAERYQNTAKKRFNYHHQLLQKHNIQLNTICSSLPLENQLKGSKKT